MIADARPSQLSAVCFDVGGVLLHRDGRFISDVVRSHTGVAIEPKHCQEAFARADRQGVMTSDPSQFLTTREMRLAWARHARVPLEAVDAVWNALHADLTVLWGELDPDAVAVLETLRGSHIGLGVISNAEGRLQEDLERAGIAEYFRAIVDSAIVGLQKPHPRIYELALRELDASPSECAYIGDTPTELIGSRDCGFGVSVLYDPHGVYRRDKLSFPRVERLHGVVALAQHRDGAA